MHRWRQPVDGEGGSESQHPDFITERSISLLRDWSDGCLCFWEVNMPNTRIATVISQSKLLSNQSTRQQLWNSSTGELLWTCQEEFDDPNLERLKLFRPKFSPSGDHVAFFHGRMTINIVDTTSNTPTEVLKIDLDAVLPMKMGLFRTFALGPQSNSLAIVYLGDTSMRRINPRVQSMDGVSIDVVTIRRGNAWSYYTQDGKGLYCVIYDKSVGHIEILKFDPETWRAHWFKKITGVSSVSFVRLAEWTGENSVAVVIDFQRSSGRLGILCQSEPERKIRGYKSSGGSLKFSYNFGDFQTFMSHGRLISVSKILGSVIDLRRPLAAARIARFVESKFLPSNELKALAFKNGRLTFISEKEARLVFIDTIPEEFSTLSHYRSK